MTECLSTPSQYVFACKELSFLLKKYSDFPKKLQSLVYEDTLYAFNILPLMQTQSAISAANSLLQSAELALPRQKRVLAVKGFKQAVVACKRKSKTFKEEEEKEEGVAQVPQDVLIHIFGRLDVPSLLSASAVCRSWNATASDNYLWKLLYDTYFRNGNDVMKNKGLGTIGVTKSETNHTDDITACGVNYRYVFEAAYEPTYGDSCYFDFGYPRGYCSSCCTIVWVRCNRCSNLTDKKDEVINHQIKFLTMEQIVEFIIDGF